jgi:hypothetical protein
MPILIDEFEIEVEPSGVPDAGLGPGADLVPLQPEEQELAALLDLIGERRARLLVD